MGVGAVLFVVQELTVKVVVGCRDMRVFPATYSPKGNTFYMISLLSCPSPRGLAVPRRHDRPPSPLPSPSTRDMHVGHLARRSPYAEPPVATKLEMELTTS